LIIDIHQDLEQQSNIIDENICIDLTQLAKTNFKGI
jgi:hypothetical protein